MRSSSGLDERRKRILYRGWHRGMRELDLILGSYLDSHISNIPDQKLDELEILLEVPDSELYNWLSGTVVIPSIWQDSLFTDILQFYKKQVSDVK